MRFAEKAQAGVVVVNGGTHGSEPHMGFGGVKDSGTGWREAGIEALDVYSDWKIVNVIADPARREHEGRNPRAWRRRRRFRRALYRGAHFRTSASGIRRASS